MWSGSTSTSEALALAAHPTATLASHYVDLGILPGYEAFGAYAGWPDLATASGPVGVGDLQPSFTYGNPYPGSWPQFVTAETFAQVRYSVDLADGGTSTPRLFSVYTYAQQPLPSGPITPQVGPPRDMRINGMVATGNLTTVGLTPRVSWTAPSVGTANYYSLRLWELYVTSSGLTSRLQVTNLRTTETQLRLPPGLLAPGKSYYLQVSAVSVPSADPNKPYLGGPVYHSAMAVTGRFNP